MSAFEDFIQVELPRRPWVATDPAQETIPVRRGAGPRQLDFVPLTDGQVLGRISGVVQGITIPGLGSGMIPKSYNYTQTPAASVWTITHNLNSLDCIAIVYDDAGHQIIPDSFNVIDANTVTVTFISNVAGRAIIVFTS
jgi:hypothetical protein